MILSFTRKLETSPKAAVREIYAIVKNDCRSVTGANLRNINLECMVDPSRPYSDVSVQKKQFFPTPPDAEWKISLIQDLIDMRDGGGDSTWNKEEINDALEYLCTSWWMLYISKSFIWFERNDKKKKVLWGQILTFSTAFSATPIYHNLPNLEVRHKIPTPLIIRPAPRD